MSELTLLRPWWLAALPLLIVLALWTWRRGADAGGWRQVMPAPMLRAMRALGHLRGETGRAGLSCLAAAALLALGLAGPAVPRTDAPVLAGNGAVLIAIDMSPSVATSPALADAQAAAAQILRAANGRAVGLILYSGEAYDVAAPTADPATLETQIAVLGPDTMPGQGSRPAAALALARQMLSDVADADLVLISDGGGFGAEAAAEAERLTGGGARLSLLTLSGAAGPPPASALEWDVFQSLTAVSVAAPARAPDPVLGRISSAASLSRDSALTALRFHDLGPLFAVLALFPVLALFRRPA
ncbi:VWA domain-containing protein [Roseibium marinum]|uniref:Ca-activated chloride channel family protein n=1 Tax=Roseibium marinum TaxID=281252 RepID=A0A2S3V4B2_9HYPH|nr:VWA domain-containing protein [Roseibium marinum]POF34801.1 Ca-activated chloride channel family protein [Roseibium marinum]